MPTWSSHTEIAWSQGFIIVRLMFLPPFTSDRTCGPAGGGDESERGWLSLGGHRYGFDAQPNGSIRPLLARLGGTFFALGFLLQCDPSVRDLQQHGAMFFRHRHCQTLTFLRESPVRCGVTHRCPPTPVWGELNRNFGFLFTKI